MRKKTENKVWLDTGVWFCILALLGVLTTVISLLLSSGENFAKIFFHDGADTGMDFFHSIEYTRGRLPYELFGTLYPPLANLLFLFLFQMVPESQHSMWAPTFSEGVAMRRSYYDLRLYQPTMLLFIFFLIITAALLILLVQRCVKEMQPGKCNLIAFSCLLTHGVLYGYERGNIIIIAMMCTLFFMQYYNADSKILSELALLALAVAAGLKIYPALFGAVLLYNRQYKKAIRTVIYGIAFFVLPVFIFREGLGGLVIFFGKLTKHAASSRFSTNGYGFDKLVNMLTAVWCHLLNKPINEEFLLSVIPKWNIVVSGVMLLCGFVLRKQWQQALVCCLAMFLYSEQGVYGTMFYLIPLILFIVQEKHLTLTNFVPFLAMTAFVIILPIIDSKEAWLSFTNLRFQICQIILVLYILIHSITHLMSKFLKKQTRGIHACDVSVND